MTAPIVRLVAWLLATLPVLLILGGTLHYTDCRLAGLCIGLMLEALVAACAIKGKSRCAMSFGVCLCVALIGWVSLAVVALTCPAVGGQALLPLKLIQISIGNYNFNSPERR